MSIHAVSVSRGWRRELFALGAVGGDGRGDWQQGTWPMWAQGARLLEPATGVCPHLRRATCPEQDRATRARSSTAARVPSARVHATRVRVRRDARAAASLDRAANNRRRSHHQPAATSRDRSSLGNVSEAGVQETPVRACRGCRAHPPQSACAVLDTGRVYGVHVQVRRAAAVVQQEKVAKEVGACPPRFCRTRRVCV